MRALAIAAAGAVLTAVLVAPAQAAQPEGDCIIFCDNPKAKTPRSKGGDCIFFCPQQHKAPGKSPGHHGGIEWAPTKRGECVIFCGEGYRQRKFHDPGPLFGEDWWKS